MAAEKRQTKHETTLTRQRRDDSLDNVDMDDDDDDESYNFERRSAALANDEAKSTTRRITSALPGSCKIK